MRPIFATILVISIAVACMGLWRSAVPGGFGQFLFGIILLGVFAGAAMAMFGVPFAILYFIVNYYDIQERRRKFDQNAFQSKFDKPTIALALATPLVGIVFLIVCMAQIPETIGFSVARPQFEAAAAEYEARQAAMPPNEKGRFIIGKRFGIYEVDMVGIDGRGGIYFRVNTGSDGIGPDQMSYGFAKKPNATGSPFGRKYYDPIHLVDDWYFFSASDDFY